MNLRTIGIPLAVLLTIMDAWATFQLGPPIWEVWAADPFKRICILLLAGTASATLCHAWFQILAIRKSTATHKASLGLPASEASDV